MDNWDFGNRVPAFVHSDSWVDSLVCQKGQIGIYENQMSDATLSRFWLAQSLITVTMRFTISRFSDEIVRIN
uniref:Uncharacterized protein n=1 Tax=Spironucleus salmonicida TaxID=348837 RepID=V6LXN1_9EUKA|eukprot:EST49008.1 Hypothetical protein SS50377_10737 [Spironucleus salmonicida]